MRLESTEHSIELFRSILSALSSGYEAPRYTLSRARVGRNLPSGIEQKRTGWLWMRDSKASNVMQVNLIFILQ